MVEQRVDVAHLVGGDDDGARVVHARGYEAAEGHLAGDVEAVGGFVHQHQRRVAGQGEAHEHLLALAHREARKLVGQVGVNLEGGEMAAQVVVREVGVEGRVHGHIVAEREVGQCQLLGHDEHRGHRVRVALAGHGAVEFHAAACRRQQSGYQIEQRAFAHAVAAQQAVHPAFGHRQRQVVDGGVVAAGVLECEIIYFQHDVEFVCSYARQRSSTQSTAVSTARKPEEADAAMTVAERSIVCECYGLLV